jgi:hypothetical protein
MSFLEDNASFEGWLRTQCDVYEPDLKHKHKRMKRDAFTFLRATYFRWAKGIEDVCQELKDTPAVLTAGDLHLENFGTWRDTEGRLVWGVNDLDEAAVIPYAYDLVRLAVSAQLARDAKDAEEGGLAPFVTLSDADAADAILAGYREGLNSPRPTLLDEQETWLRPYVACSDGERAKFWTSKIDPLPDERPGDAVMAGFTAAFPQDASIIRTMRRPKQGGGSLGRPRFVAVANWRGGRIVREAKAIVPSAWDWAHGDAEAAVRLEDLSNGLHRSPDPWLRISGRYIFRRLAADARKVDLAKKADSDAPSAKEANALKLLQAMGFDVGAMHATEASQAAAITQDLDTRDPSWLHTAAATAVHRVKQDYEGWCEQT